MSITLRQLEHARALARRGNFREAAAELNLTQPALSRSIQALEKSMGTRLFERLPQGVEPTPAGRLLLAKSRLILQAKLELERDIGLFLGVETGSLVVSMGPYPGHILVPRAVAALTRKHPGLTCRLRDADWTTVPQHLVHRESDIAVAETSLASRNDLLEVETLGIEQCHFACRPHHPLTGKRDVSLSDVLAYPLAGCGSPARIGGALGTGARGGTIDPDDGFFHPAIEVDTISAAITITMSSDAVTAMTLSQLAPELESGRLALLRVRPNPIHLNYGLIYLKSRTLAPAATEFIDEVRRIKLELDQFEERLSIRYGTAR